jgi:hypothetical protein
MNETLVKALDLQAARRIQTYDPPGVYRADRTMQIVGEVLRSIGCRDVADLLDTERYELTKAVVQERASLDDAVSAMLAADCPADGDPEANGVNAKKHISILLNTLDMPKTREVFDAVKQWHS